MPITTNNQIFSNTGRQFWHLWIVACVWNIFIGFTFIKGWHGIQSAVEANPVFYFILSFPVIGLWIIFQAIQQTIAWYKFGKTPLTLDPFPGQIGGRCAGHLVLPISRKHAQRAILSLSCIRRYRHRSNNGKVRSHAQTVWQDKISLKPDSYGRKLQLSFSFSPPADLPETEANSDDYHIWMLQVRIPLPGIDYDRSFELPMQTVGEYALASHHRYPTKMSTIIPHHDTDTGSTPQITETATGRQFYFGYGRSKGMGISLLFFGLFIALFAYYFFSGFLDFLPATTSLMAAYVGLTALFLVLFGLLLIANSLTIEVGLMGVRKQQRIFGFQIEEIIEADDIFDIVTEQNASSSSGNTTRVWFCLNLITRDGQSIEIGDSLEGQSYADEIREQMISALGNSWRPAIKSTQAETNKRPIPVWLRKVGKILSYSFVIALLYDLSLMFPEIPKLLAQFLSK